MRWQMKDDIQDIPLFVESIPFDETRNYVKLVTWGRQLYQRSHDVSSGPPLSSMTAR